MSGERELLERARDAVFHAKTIVRVSRNHFKLQAAQLQAAEERIDGLIDELDALRVPTPEEAQEHDRDEAQLAHRSS